jgi:hypothetical protein
VDDGVEVTEPVDLVGDRFRFRNARKIADNDVVGGDLFPEIVCPRGERACSATACPCSIKSSAAIFPRPSDDPVTNTRAILQSFLRLFGNNIQERPFRDRQALGRLG